MNKTVMNWSGGKDSALALWHVLQSGQYAVETLLTTLNAANRRVSMHGVREDLLASGEPRPRTHPVGGGGPSIPVITTTAARQTGAPS